MALSRYLRLSLVVLVLSGVLPGAPASSTASVHAETAFTFVGQAGFYTKSLAVRDDTLYVASGRRLLVVDASDRTALRVIGLSEAFGADIDTMVLAWPYVYLTWWEDPPETYRYQVVSIVDVSTPSAPVIVGRLNMPIDNLTRGLAAAGRHAWVADGKGIWLVDATDLHAPELPWPGRLARGSTKLAASGDLLCVSGPTTLDVYDYADPRAPQLAGQCVTPYAPHGVTMADARAYVADNGLAVVDLSDPTTPTLSGYCATPHVASEVAVSGGRACALDTAGWLMLVDVSDPQAPTFMGECAVPAANAVAMSGERGYVVTNAGGLVIVSLADPSAPAVVAEYHYAPSYALAVADGYAYLLGDDALTVVDVSNPAQPVVRGSCAVESGWAWDVAVEGDHAYVSVDSGLKVVDVSDPTTPAVVGQYPTARWSLAVTARDDLVYVLSESGGLLLIDVSLPYSPTLVSTCSMSGAAYAGDLVLVDDLLYVPGGNSALVIVDVQDPHAPTILSQYSTPLDVRGVAVVGNTAYVQDVFNGVYVLDVTDPTAPVLLDQIDVGVQVGGIAVLGDYLCVIMSDIRVNVINIATSGPPQLLADCFWEGTPYDIKADGGYLYVAGGGLTVLRCGKQETHKVSLAALRMGQTPPAPVPVELVRAVPWSALTGTPTGVDTGGPYWYRAVSTGYGTGYLDILSLADPAAPALVGRYTAPNNTSIRAWAQSGDHLYVAPDYGDVMYLVDISDAAAPVDVASWAVPDIISIALVDGSLLVIAWDSSLTNNYLRVYSLADPASPVEVGSCQIGSREGVSRINVVGDIAWVNTTDWRSNYYGELTAIDISDLSHPQKLGSCYVEGYGLNPALSSNYAYVGSGRRKALTTVDLSDASAPRVVHHLPLPGNSSGAVLWGAYACTTSGDYVAVVDVSDPRAPFLRTLWDAGAPVEPLVAVGEYLYASTEGALLILRLAHAL